MLAELENIDDDTDRFGVQFVKVADKKVAKSYGIKTFPALSFFRNKEPIHYEGKLFIVLPKAGCCIPYNRQEI